MARPKFIPRVPILRKVLVQLEDPPHVRLVILLVLRVYRIQFTYGTRRGEERAHEERCKASESAFESGGPNIEVVIGIGCSSECI